MLKLIVFGLATGAAIQAWRNFPADGPISGDSLALVFVFGVLAAFASGFFMGRPWRTASATAVAVATARAQAEAAASSQSNSSAAVNLLIAQGGIVRGAQPVGLSVPTPETVSWMGDRPALSSVEDLDGMDLSDLGYEDSVEQQG